MITPEPFTWLTFGSVPYYYQPRKPLYSEVKGIDGAGTDFMKAVFDLKPGEVGVATNQPKLVDYVVRLAEYTPSDSVLWDMFTADQYGQYALAGQVRHRRRGPPMARGPQERGRIPLGAPSPPKAA